jgi:hypothetical protein
MTDSSASLFSNSNNNTASIEMPTRQMDCTSNSDMEMVLFSSQQHNVFLYRVYSALLSSRWLQSPKYQATTTCVILPLDAEWRTVSEQPTFVWCHISQPEITLNCSNRSISNLISDYDQWVVRSLDCPAKGTAIARFVIQGNAIAICDGSYKDQFGTAWFVIQRHRCSH